MNDYRMKIEGTETLDRPNGLIATKAGALRFARVHMPADLKKAGFSVGVFHGARAWVINYGRTV